MFVNAIRPALLALAVVLLLVTLASPACARTIVVGPAGDADAEYNSISAAISQAAAGDTIVVRSGCYRENVNVDRPLKLTGTDTGGGMPVVDAAGHRGIEINAGHSLVRGFRVTNGSPGIYVSGFFNHSITGITVADNEISNIAGAAIVVENTDGNRISGNRAYAAQTGIELKTNDNFVERNEIYNMSSAGIMVAGAGNALTANTVHDCRTAGIFIDGIDNSVNANNVYGCLEGIMLISGTFNSIANNVAHENTNGL